MKVPTHAPAYVSLYPVLCEIGIENGYSIAIHGSVRSDFDLIAVPWTDSAIDAYELVKIIGEYVSLINGANHELGSIVGPEQKPHGRLAWAIPIGNGGVIDLSITPKIEV